jgi:hypothetical protein
MGADDDDAVGYEQARRLRITLAAANIDRGRLWLHYFSLGGNISDFEVDAYLHHSLALPRLQRDLLAHAANEILAGMTPPQAPYASDVLDENDSPAAESTGSMDSRRNDQAPRGRDSDVVGRDDPPETPES